MNSIPTPRRIPLTQITRIVALVIGSLVSTASAQTSIGVNFVGGRHTTGPDASSVTGTAGVVPQSNWNNVGAYSDTFNVSNGEPLADGSSADLIDSQGNNTNANIAWEADNTFASLNPFIDNEDERLMDGYIDLSGSDRDVTVDFTNIPFAAYDVYIYVGSDGQTGRISALEINNDSDNLIWYEANTGGGLFQSALDYSRAIAATPEDAVKATFGLFENVSGSSLTVKVRGDLPGAQSNSGIHGIQLVQRLADSILWVDDRTGRVFIQGGDTVPVGLNGIEIASAEGALEVSRFESLGVQGLDLVDGPDDLDTIPGNSPGESWQTVLQSESKIIEGFLYGSTQLDSNSELALGQLYDISAGLDPLVDLSFTYGVTSGLTVTGQVQTFTSFLPGDYNNDGIVDAGDYPIYRENLGAVGLTPFTGADGNGDGQVTPEDLVVWQNNLGSVVSLSSVAPTAASIPEPTAIALSLISCLVCFNRLSRSGWRQ